MIERTPITRYVYEPDNRDRIEPYRNVAKSLMNNSRRGVWFIYEDSHIKLMSGRKVDLDKDDDAFIEFTVRFPEYSGKCYGKKTEEILKYLLDDVNIPCTSNWSGYREYDEINDTTRHSERMRFRDINFKKPKGIDAHRHIYINYDNVDRNDIGDIKGVMVDTYEFNLTKEKDEFIDCFSFFIWLIMDYYDKGGVCNNTHYYYG